MNMKSKDIKMSCWGSKDNSVSLTEQVYLCPVCNGDTKEVRGITVRHFVVDNLTDKVNEDTYHICLNEDCDVIYYDLKSKTIFRREDIKIPIGFKKDANPKYICYCNKVTEEQIINAVLNDGAKDIKDIVRLTGAMKNANCEINNPLGKCCSPSINATIIKGLKIKNHTTT